jgi:hypothetical protein
MSNGISSFTEISLIPIVDFNELHRSWRLLGINATVAALIDALDDYGRH